MFERFTDRARRVTVLAQEEARMLNHNYIGTEHFLLGLIHEGEGVAAQALKALGVSLEGVRTQVETIIGQGHQLTSGHIPFTPRAKRVMELALREALQFGHPYIGTEHILLGLIREGEGVAAQVLGKLGMDLIRVRQQVIKQLSGSRAKERPSSRIEVLDRMAKEVAKAIASDTETIRGLSENFGKYRWQLDQLKVLATDTTGPPGGLSIRSITVLDEATPQMALVQFSDGSQAVLREDHLRVIGYEAIQTAGKS